MSEKKASPRSGGAAKGYTPGGDRTQAFVDLLDAGNAQAQLIMKAVAQHADWETGECHPSARALAEIGKCSVKTVRRYLKQLVSDGLIEMEARFADGESDNGRRTSNRITLVGYAEWASANRNGGVVKRPAKVARYDEPPPGQDDHGPGQADQGGTGQDDHGPLVNGSMALANPTTGPGQPESPGALVNKVTSTNELDSNSHSNLSPPTPRSRRRSRREREREEFSAVIEEVRSRPGCAQVVDLLLRPILSKRRFDWVDPAYTMAGIADWAKQFPADVLQTACRKVLEACDWVVAESTITEAVRDACVVAGDARPIDRPHARQTLRGVLIDPASHPQQWSAWESFLEEAGADFADPAAVKHRVNLGLMRNYGKFLAPSEYPPSAPHTEGHA